jgi:hypothetical protein
MPRTVGAGGIPATKRAVTIAAVEGGRKCVSGPFEAWATSDDAACRLLLDSRRGNDLFCRISMDGVCQDVFGCRSKLRSVINR